MARFIINDLLYDTDKMEFIADVKKWYECRGFVEKIIFGEGVGKMYDCKLYRSQKGNFLLVSEQDYKIIGEPISEEEAKRLWRKYDYETYAKCYGELEEA